MSWEECVREFTQASEAYGEFGQDPIDAPQFEFLARLVLEELLEIGATCMTVDEAKVLIANIVSADQKTKATSPNHADQMDGLVDLIYVTLNFASRKGWNLQPIFDAVHQANMAKRDPVTLKFKRNEHGKIIKPDGWTPPNINDVVPLALSPFAKSA